MTVSLELAGVCKSFGAVETVRNVDLAVARGEFIVIVGPSGCGKSTLLRMIAGLEGVSEGEIRINGRRVNDVPPKDRDIAMVFQSYALYPHMTVAENMGFALRLRGEPRTEIAAKVDQAAQLLGLETYLDRFPRQLSGGQRQRVAIGRSIVRDPELFLFDEPLSNLDAKMRVQMRTEIKTLHQRLGNTMIYVTHDQIEAMTMADRIVVMRGGEVMQIGRPLELYDLPANLFIAQFIGSPAMNLYDGRIEAGMFRWGEGTALALPPGAAQHEGRAVKLGVRPEHFQLVSGDVPGLPGTVRVVEPTGTDIMLTVDTPAGEAMILYREALPGQVGEGVRRETRPYAPGEQVVLSPRHVHLFDAASGARL
jgi:multiple sugar transport system ATP-binding protein